VLITHNAARAHKQWRAAVAQAAFASVLNSVSDYGIIFFPEGTYLLRDQFIISKRVVLKGGRQPHRRAS
jgi:hypothetical protein